MGKGKIRLTNCVKDYRKQQGVTQQQLAETVGITRQTVNAIEGNKYSPSLEVAFLISRHLNAPVETLFQLELD
jgi:putative transcriptional regulator